MDGRVGFTGGLNIGDEYLGKHPKFGHWRDTHLRIEGPAVEGLQRVFLEDWHFATDEAVHGRRLLPAGSTSRPATSLVQVVHSGPDAEYKAIRETYFAGILNARERVWIASPYFVPDAGLRDALVLAAASGVDVRFLGLFRPDKWIPFLAARFYWTDMLARRGEGVPVRPRDDAHQVSCWWTASGRRSARANTGQPQPATELRGELPALRPGAGGGTGSGSTCRIWKGRCGSTRRCSRLARCSAASPRTRRGCSRRSCETVRGP